MHFSKGSVCNQVMLGKHNIQIERKLETNLPQIMADPSKISQVFLNIIINAVQAMGENGILTIVTSVEKEYCRIEFSDNGPGINPQLKGKIFNAFFTTKEESAGTGLGLTVSRTFITQHGGTIEADFNKKDGAAFIIKLPLKGDQDI